MIKAEPEPKLIPPRGKLSYFLSFALEDDDDDDDDSMDDDDDVMNATLVTNATLGPYFRKILTVVFSSDDKFVSNWEDDTANEVEEEDEEYDSEDSVAWRGKNTCRLLVLSV